VLLSPACASLDMFRNYAHRAEVFVDAVRALAAGERGGWPGMTTAARPPLVDQRLRDGLGCAARREARGALPVRDQVRRHAAARAPACRPSTSRWCWWSWRCWRWAGDGLFGLDRAARQPAFAATRPRTS
jgi:hypothetical protein